MCGHFASLDDEDDGRDVDQTRAYACEVVGWRVAVCLPEEKTMQHLLLEVPGRTAARSGLESEHAEARAGQLGFPAFQSLAEFSDERTPLNAPSPTPSVSNGSVPTAEYPFAEELASTLEGLNAIEIVVVFNAKDFVSQNAIQKIVNGLWVGDNVMWSEVSPDAVKRPRKHKPLYVRPILE